MNYLQNYRDLKRARGVTLRSRFRHLLLDVLAHQSRSSLDERFDTPRVQFIYIHHVFRDEEESLRTLLTKLSEKHTFISHTDAWTKVLSGKIDKPYMSFSSDDGFLNNRRAAAIFNEFNASACFFICPSMIGVKDPNVISRFCKDKLHIPPVEFMDWDDIHRLQRDGHEIGSHTLSHVNIADTAISALDEEIGTAFTTIKERCGEGQHFAFPYGRHVHFNAAARECIFRFGHTSCSSAERGCHLSNDHPIGANDLLIRRDHVVLDWPIEHNLYFLARNAADKRFQQSHFRD